MLQPVGFINRLSVKKEEAIDNRTNISLVGKVTRLSQGQKIGTLFADVRAGSITLTVKITESHLAAMTLHRGWPVTLTYRKDSIDWQ